jgi:hypothetical protein
MTNVHVCNQDIEGAVKYLCFPCYMLVKSWLLLLSYAGSPQCGSGFRFSFAAWVVVQHQIIVCHDIAGKMRMHNRKEEELGV